MIQRESPFDAVSRGPGQAAADSSFLTPRHSAALGAMGLLLVAAAVLATRRLAGGFLPPATVFPAAIAATAACGVATVVAAMCRTAFRRDATWWGTIHPAGRAAIGAAILHLPALLVGLALVPARPSGTLVALVLLLAASVGHVAIRIFGGSGLRSLARRAWHGVRGKAGHAPSIFDPAVASEFDDDPGLTQWLRRRTTAAGEVIEGGLRVEFLAGQKQASVHASFVPPLTGTPAVECQPVAGDAHLRLKVGAAHPWGIRLDARRSEATDEPAAALVAFTAR